MPVQRSRRQVFVRETKGPGFEFRMRYRGYVLLRSTILERNDCPSAPMFSLVVQLRSTRESDHGNSVFVNYLMLIIRNRILSKSKTFTLSYFNLINLIMGFNSVIKR